MEKEEIKKMLMECVNSNDFIKWNQFKRQNRKLKFDLSGYSLEHLKIEKFNLDGIIFDDASLKNTLFENCTLNNASFKRCECFSTHFIKCSMVSTHFISTNLAMAVFDICDLRFSDFSQSKIHQVNMIECQGNNCCFKNASFNDTSLSKCIFKFADLTACEVSKVELDDANFEASIVDGNTIIWDCYYNKETNFTGVGLASCRIEPVLMSSFQCNIRRIWWQKWYREKMDQNKTPFDETYKGIFKKLFGFISFASNWILTLTVKSFWWITDYGSSTIRLLSVFFISTLFFTSVYILFPHLTNDLILNTSHNYVMVFVRSLYFSIVINTGLGFGEINASDSSIAGHIIISLHSLLGFILLGAFLVRIGILFQGEFPVSPTRKNNKSSKI